MKESNNNQFEGVQMPPAWCSGICRNAMNEICIEVCALKRDCSGFEPKPNLRLDDLPRFPLQESSEMTKEEKFTSVTVYLSAVVDELKGVPIDEPIRSRRPRPNRERCGNVLENIEVKDLLPDPKKTDAVHQDRET
jgi:hypothetical protein